MDLWTHFSIWSTLLVASFCQDVLFEPDSETDSVSYRELETLGVACNRDDTCEGASANRRSRNCQCDRSCAYFGDCCLDAPNRAPFALPTFSNPVCNEILPNLGYYRIERCMRGWRDAEVKRKCEGRPSLLDPLTSVPVTAKSTTFTYKNHFCAICNNVRDDLVYWKLGADCPKLNSSMENYIRQNITYDTNRGSWGVHIQHEFYPCSLRPSVPEEKRLMRICYPNLVSACPSNWADEVIRKKCGSYTAYLENKGNGVIYRNVHCALCNNVGPRFLACGIQGREFERTSFSSLFDINLAKGNAIGGGGTAPRCAEGEVYDLALERCQKLTCLPFQELRDGRCVLKSGK